MVLGQNLKIFQFFVLGNISQENVFDDILELMKAVLDCKYRKLKESKNWDLCCCLFLARIGLEIMMFSVVLDKKKAWISFLTTNISLSPSCESGLF